MTASRITRLVLPAACMFGLALAPALAQTASGTDAAKAPNSTLSTPAAGPAASAGASSGGMSSGSAADASKAPMSSTNTMGAGTKSGSHSRLPSGEAFKTMAAATAHCPSDTVVWSTLSKSKSYHLSSSKYFGKTKHGAYVCEKDATAAGFHQAKT